MRKSVFTVLAIAAMVVSASSCSQNDNGSSNDLNLQENINTNETNVNDSSSAVKVTSRGITYSGGIDGKPII